MPTNPNAAKAGSSIKKIPTGKQVAKPEPEPVPEPEPELFTLDQLLIAQIIEGLESLKYNFPEGDPRLVRLYQARMCLIDYAGLEILLRLEVEAAQRQQEAMARVMAQREQEAPMPPQTPQRPVARRSRAAEDVEAEFKTTGEVVKNLVSEEGDEEVQPEEGETEPVAEMPDEEGAGEEVPVEGEVPAEGEELPGDEGAVDPYEKDILEDPDAQLPGLEGIPHIGGQKKLPPAPVEGPETRESRSLVDKILNKEKGVGQPILSPQAAPGKQQQKGKQPAAQKKEHIDSVG